MKHILGFLYNFQQYIWLYLLWSELIIACACSERYYFLAAEVVKEAVLRYIPNSLAGRLWLLYNEATTIYLKREWRRLVPKATIAALWFSVNMSLISVLYRHLAKDCRSSI
jgi:hypothetical protein